MLGLAVMLAAATPAVATVTSPAAEHVALTVYRDPSRGRWQSMNLQWLGGFALVTETRLVHLPAGRAVIRFEGVADGIIPASAIVTGLPDGVIEKNRDARLLSPASLVDGTLGRDVTLTRTDRKTGKVSREDATIVAGPGKGVVLKTSSGIETLRCAGLPEGLSYDGVPSGLTARPVLSVTTHSAETADATVTLSYLAGGFDWSASYVATVADKGETLNLFGWLTLANGNARGWQDVRLQAIAGRIERQYGQEIAAAAARLELQCFPLGTTTSDLPTIEPYRRERAAAFSDKIIVTASRRFAPPIAAAPPPPPPPPPPPEDLGDLKLYRVPEPVDIASNGEKQVALLLRPRVAFEKVYRLRFSPWQPTQRVAATIVLRLRNDERQGLGIALPAGTTTLYRSNGDGRLLLGTGTIGDVAKGEKTRLTAGTSTQVQADQRSSGRQRWVSVSNANPYPVTVEVALGAPGDTPYTEASRTLERVDGLQTWRVTLPANATSSLRYNMPKTN